MRHPARVRWGYPVRIYTEIHRSGFLKGVYGPLTKILYVVIVVFIGTRGVFYVKNMPFL